MSKCDMCGINYNTPRMTDDGYFAFDFFAMHFCPNCTMKIFERTEKFKNLTIEEIKKYNILKTRLMNTRYWE